MFCRGSEKCSKTVPRRLPGAIFEQNPVGEPFGGLLGAHENDKNTKNSFLEATGTRNFGAERLRCRLWVLKPELWVLNPELFTKGYSQTLVFYEGLRPGFPNPRIL